MNKKKKEKERKEKVGRKKRKKGPDDVIATRVTVQPSCIECKANTFAECF